jgi:hypothetical protein
MAKNHPNGIETFFQKFGGSSNALSAQYTLFLIIERLLHFMQNGNISDRSSCTFKAPIPGSVGDCWTARRSHIESGLSIRLLKRLIGMADVGCIEESPFLRGLHHCGRAFERTFTQDPESVGRSIRRCRAPRRHHCQAHRRQWTDGMKHIGVNPTAPLAILRPAAAGLSG